MGQKLDVLIAVAGITGFLVGPPVISTVVDNSINNHVIMREGKKADPEGDFFDSGNDVGIAINKESGRVAYARSPGISTVYLNAPIDGKYVSGREMTCYPRRGCFAHEVTETTRPNIFSAINLYLNSTR